jgi:hypothetical protein
MLGDLSNMFKNACLLKVARSYRLTCGKQGAGGHKKKDG